MPTRLRPYLHCYGSNDIHLVFVTKFRHPVISEEMESGLKEIFDRICQTQGCELLECKADLGKKDHIHLLVKLAPRIALSKLVNLLKTVSSREMRKEFAEELKPYYWKPFLWKRGYGFVSSGGASLDVLKKYIENQGYED
jgi:putative transposase